MRHAVCQLMRTVTCLAEQGLEPLGAGGGEAFWNLGSEAEREAVVILGSPHSPNKPASSGSERGPRKRQVPFASLLSAFYNVSASARNHWEWTEQVPSKRASAAAGGAGRAERRDHGDPWALEKCEVV